MEPTGDIYRVNYEDGGDTVGLREVERHGFSGAVCVCVM